MSYFKFEVIHQSRKSRARVGKITTPHGVIETPNFVGVGTNGTIKGLENSLVDDLDLQLMFCNTYHLLLQPGPDVVKNGGGLHSFINRKKPIITDSGGFQVFSLAAGKVSGELKSRGCKGYNNSVLKITEEGVLFRSYRDGAKFKLTPESSVETQKALGADIIIPLDELLPYSVSEKALKASLDRTHRWEKRSLDTHLKNKNNQAMYAVIHGGVDRKLRFESCDHLSKLPFDGYAIGGSLGKDRNEMHELLKDLMPRLPESHPNHLLGIGDMESIKRSIPEGVDTFDSCYPTRSARHGVLLTKQGPLKVGKTSLSNHHQPAEEGCPCPLCTRYSVAYLNHLFKANELTAHSLASAHNIAFMVRTMKEMREKILNDEI